MHNEMIGKTHPHPEWRILVAHLSGADYGTEISHVEIATLTGLSYPSQRYFQQVARTRHALLTDWSRELETVSGQGYRLVHPDEFHGRSRREVKLAGKRLRVGKAILIAAPQHLLTPEDNRRNADALAKLGTLESLRRGYLRETRPALPAPPDNPKQLGTGQETN